VVQCGGVVVKIKKTLSDVNSASTNKNVMRRMKKTKLLISTKFINKLNVSAASS